MTALPPHGEALAEAARAERDRRGEDYPPKLLAAPDKAEAMSIDYQCWHALAGFFETGRFAGFHGGAEPERDDAPWISWPELDAAAERALASVDKSLAKREAEGTDAGELHVRRARLFCIHRIVARRRETIDLVNAHFRKAPAEATADATAGAQEPKAIAA